MTRIAAKNGALISPDDSKKLSRRLKDLAEQNTEIWTELAKQGYERPAHVMQEAYRRLAGSPQKYEQLVLYWTEYAKERLAALTGPVDILHGQMPYKWTYRSPFLDGLRANVGQLKSDGPIVSPQIEPTIKRYVELFPDDPLRVAVSQGVRAARKEGADALGLRELPGFSKMDEEERYGMLVKHYRTRLEPAGFRLDSHRKHGVVFRKVTSDARWAFVFIDTSRNGMLGGRLDTQIAITLPKKAMLSNAVSLTAAATFLPDDLVPGFGAICGFEKDSYAQLCLASEANSFLADSLFRHFDRLSTDLQ
jgi:hypothetical protein